MATNPVASSASSHSRISVWWDIENCAVPNGTNPHSIAHNIRQGLSDMGYHGTITISAYGDVHLLSKTVTEALTSTWISLHHVTNGRKDASDKAILVGLLLWALDNPPPCHVFLISGDRDFSNALHGLQNRRYNVLLSCNSRNKISPSLLGSANKVWDWTKLAKGEGLLDLPSLKSTVCSSISTHIPPNDCKFKSQLQSPHPFVATNIRQSIRPSGRKRKRQLRNEGSAKPTPRPKSKPKENAVPQKSKGKKKRKEKGSSKGKKKTERKGSSKGEKKAEGNRFSKGKAKGEGKPKRQKV